MLLPIGMAALLVLSGYQVYRSFRPKVFTVDWQVDEDGEVQHQVTERPVLQDPLSR